MLPQANCSIVGVTLPVAPTGEADTILSLISTITEEKKRPWDSLLLWVRPKPCCLAALAEHVRAANISAVASVGCGTGLLEWLVQAHTGIEASRARWLRKLPGYLLHFQL